MKPWWAAFALCAWCAAWAPWQASASGSAVSNDPRDILAVDERVGWDMNYPLEHARPERSRYLADFFRGATAQSVAAFLDSEQLLQQAARYTDSADVIAFLIESGYDPNEAFGTGTEGYPQGLGAEPVYDDDGGLVYAGNGGIRREGPIHFAAKYNPNPSIVEALVQGGADVHAPAGHGLNTPLQHAARHNNGAVVAALLRAGARVDDVNGRIRPMYSRRPNINGNTALHEAGANEDASVVDVLVDAGADVDGRNASGLTPLHFAAIHGRGATLVALARRGADPNTGIDFAESEEETHECLGCNAFELLVRTLADRVDGYEKHALDDADLEQARNLLQALAEAGANIDAAGGALDLVVRAGLGPRLVSLLIDSGVAVEPYLLEAVFAPSFQYAASYAGGFRSRAVGSQENLRVLDLLMDEGLDVKEADFCGLTALHRVASSAYRRENSGLVRAVRKLAAVGVDVNARTVEAGDYCDDFGLTPLHMAADSGALDVASALIDAGANTEAKDAQGRMPLDVAAERHYLDLVLLLLRKSRFTSLAAMSRDQNVAGSFTAADANERLLVEVASERHQLVSLVDEQGAETPLVVLDLQSEYEGLCFDDETQTHTAVFVRSERSPQPGSARGLPLARNSRQPGGAGGVPLARGSERAYYHYDADARRLVKAFVEGDAAHAPERWPAACQWREMRDWQAGLKAYERALGTLAPPSDDLAAGEPPKDLPIRAIPTAEVESTLATLRGLPNVAVESVPLEWPRWKLVVVKHADAYNPWAGRPGHEHGHGCAGFLLVWDETKQEWRSLFPCAKVVGTETEPFSEDTLLLQHYRSSECGPQRSQPCLLRMNLTAWQAQLYQTPLAYMESHFEVVPVPGGAENTEQ